MGNEEAASQPSYEDYVKARFVPVLCRGYHAERNPTKDYERAKIPAFKGWQDSEYVPPTLEQIAEWDRASGWIGWKPPEGTIILDVDKGGAQDIARAKDICQTKKIEPAVHRSNSAYAYHLGFCTSKALSGASDVFLRCGIEATYRVSVNQVIFAPVNGRKWEKWIEPAQWPTLPDEFLPYDKKSLDDVLACLSWQIGVEKRRGTYGTYEELLSFLTFLEECGLSKDRIETAFELVFPKDYDAKRTEYFIDRTKGRLDEGTPVVGAGSFFKSLKDRQLGGKDNPFGRIEQFARELQAVTGIARKKGATEDRKAKETQAEKLVRIGSALPLFHDDMNDAFVELSGRNVKVRSGTLKQYLAKTLWEHDDS